MTPIASDAMRVTLTFAVAGILSRCRAVANNTWRQEMMERLAQRIMAIGALSLLALAALAGAPERAAAQNLEPVSVIVFPGGFNWPIWVAQEKGYFAKGGIEVKLTPTPNSVFQLTNLIEGKFDIAMTAIDNLIAYQEGQGEAPVSGTPD